MALTFLELLCQVNSSPVVEHKDVWHFYSHDGQLLGKVLPFVAAVLSRYSCFECKEQTIRMTSFDSFESRNQAIAEMCSDLRSQDAFDVLKGWRNELYPVYGKDGIYFLIERCAACLLGLVTYGVHITGYVPPNSTNDLMLWVPKRSLSKPTWPGYLDNTVAGGLGFPHGPMDTCLKECAEEAGLDESFVKQAIKSVGVMTYEFQLEQTMDTELGVFQPEVEYVYDLPMPAGVVPIPVDGEVESFKLMSVTEVKQALAAGQFKYNCSLVLIDFFIRHAIITPENCDDYLQLAQNCHRQLQYPLRR